MVVPQDPFDLVKCQHFTLSFVVVASDYARKLYHSAMVNIELGYMAKLIGEPSFEEVLSV